MRILKNYLSVTHGEDFSSAESAQSAEDGLYKKRSQNTIMGSGIK